jgi:hypothetical protein
VNLSRIAAMVAALVLSASVAADEGTALFQGRWQGPWYIGMSSGKALLELGADGQGTIALTQLEGFGNAAVSLSRVEVGGKALRFSASGENGVEFKLKALLSSDGRKLTGNGKYGGFGARVEFQRAE